MWANPSWWMETRRSAPPLAGPSSRASVGGAAVGDEGDCRADRRREIAGMQALRFEHADGTEALQPPRTLGLFAVAVVGEGHDERGHAGAQNVEGRVISTLAHRYRGCSHRVAQIVD